MTRLPGEPSAVWSDAWELWRPPSLRRTDPEGMSYMVVDELTSDNVGLRLYAWPRVDQHGRLRFRTEIDTETLQLGVAKPALDDFASARRDQTAPDQPEEVRHRGVTIGDVFAIRIDDRSLFEESGALEADELPRALKGPLYDITRDAREAAKVALNAAVTPTLAVEDIEPIVEALVEESPGEQPPRPG